MANKEIEELPSNEEGVFIFKSYMHIFSNYKRIIVAVHNLQKVESMNNKNPSTFYFKFERMEDFEVFSDVALIFRAIAFQINNEDTEEKEITCCLFENPKYKTKTYIFANSADYYDEYWLENTIPKIVGRERNNGMQHIRFVAINEDTKNKLVNVLESNGLKCKVRYFMVLYDKTENCTMLIKSITCKL
jgi:hypothetical protein